MSTMVQIVRQVRNRVKERPKRSRLVTALPDGTGQSIQLPTGHAPYFPQAGTFFEFDDGTDEKCLTESVADTSADQLTGVLRGVDGTTGVTHAVNTPILIEPRWSFADISEQVLRIIDNELWPQSWVPGKATLTYQATNEYFPAPVAGIETIVYVYQLYSGIKYRLHAELLPAALSDATNFPNGAITIRRTVDSSLVYLAYRAKPTLATLTASQQHLVITGALAQLLMAEEATHVAPASSYIDRRVADGAKAKAGQLLWQNFLSGLYGDWLDLTGEEDAAKRQFSQGI